MFRELLDNPSARHPRELQSDSAKHFPYKVSSSKLELLQPSRLITDDAVILIGVASYSALDLELLDILDQSAPLWSNRFRIYVFDITACTSFADLEARLFGPPNSFARPIHRQSLTINQTPIALAVKANETIEFRQGVGPCRRLLEDLNVI
jgi:hypothetical protein